jgi:hypothetical protein
MEAFTFYVDESGTLVRRSDGAPLGLRSVGGVLLRGAAGEHDEEVRALLQAARAWLPELAHVADLSVFDLALALRALPMVDVPHRLNALAVDLRLGQVQLAHLRVQGHPARDLLRDEAGRLKTAMAQAVGLACQRFGGVIIAALEHDTSPATSRYADMLWAALWGACMHLRRCGLREVAVDAIVEQGANGWETVSAHELERRLREETGVMVSVAFFAKNAHHGLSLADTSLHQLAPRRFYLAEFSARAQTEALRVADYVEGRLGARLAAAVDSISLPRILGWDRAERLSRVDAMLGAPPPGSVRMALLSTRSLLKGGPQA